MPIRPSADAAQTLAALLTSEAAQQAVLDRSGDSLARPRWPTIPIFDGTEVANIANRIESSRARRTAM